MTRRLVFTVDLDRDVNLPLEGRVAAGSIDRGEGTSPRFSSAQRGLDLLLDLFDEVGVRATFFTEGRTAEVLDCSGLSGHCIGLHGYDHEDLTGASTGIPVDVPAVLTRGYDAVRDNIARPVCFRAPYMVSDDAILSALADLGIRHDSSVYRRPEEGLGPYTVEHGITEHPVPKSRDRSGRTIAAYLWPMHEGRRPPSDYIHMAEDLDVPEMVLATHTWHLVESRDGGPMSDDRVAENLAHVREVLVGIMDLGYTAEPLL